ncbi:MAG: protein-L-isoaspartate O-methyltransferase [Micavibrio sp.]|nr:protein-L-isoaspartate O-methyltransferase [Micavibrio sp.]HCK33426.1 protein-L-isoaspartate O-methyltransferase [Rhodospirillaceae bacterium]
MLYLASMSTTITQMTKVNIMTKHNIQRVNMVKGQIEPNDVYNEEVLNVFEKVPRENFVPSALKDVAYIDEDVEIVPGRYMLEPTTQARIVQAAITGESDYALTIGSGYGYMAAILSHFCTTVIAVEESPEVAKTASEVLAAQEYVNVVVMNAPMAQGCPKEAPYNIILFEGAVGSVPPEVIKQLADNGRLFAVERPDPYKQGHAVCYLRQGSHISKQVLFDANAPYLPGFEPATKFVF